MKALFSTLLVVTTLAFAANAHAAPLSSCAANFSSCNVFEDGQVLQLPGLAIAGDLILIDQWNGGKVSDVFRIFNDFFDTGGGTGLGTTAFLFSEDLGNLPNPSTFSVNAVFMNEAFGSGVGTIETDYNGNGTIYRIFSNDDGAPEPSTFALLGVGTAGMLLRRRTAMRRG